MKHTLVALVVALCTLTATTEALAEDEGPAWTLQVDPLTTALGFVHVQVERAVTPNLSFYVGPSLRLFDNLLEDKEEAFLGLGVEMGLRYFFSETAPEGWWVQVRGVTARLQTTEGPEKTAFGGYISALGGYTWIADGWFVLAGGVGVQYIHYKVAGLGIEGVLPAAHTTLGVAF